MADFGYQLVGAGDVLGFEDGFGDDVVFADNGEVIGECAEDRLSYAIAVAVEGAAGGFWAVAEGAEDTDGESPWERFRDPNRLWSGVCGSEE